MSSAKTQNQANAEREHAALRARYGFGVRLGQALAGAIDCLLLGWFVRSVRLATTQALLGEFAASKLLRNRRARF